MPAINEIKGRVIDVDNHYYEPVDVFTRYIDPKFRDLAIQPNDTRLWSMGDDVCVGFAPPAVPQDIVPPPGFTAGVFSGTDANMDDFVGAAAQFEITPDHLEWSQREPRLKVMDEQGLEAIMLLPSSGVTLEHELSGRPDALCANYRAFNRWLEEEWGYGTDRRVFPVPILTLLELDWALEELERVVEAGSRFFWLSHRPFNGKSPADPSFDPFWARAEEAGARLVYHFGFEGYTYLYGQLWGEDPRRSLPMWSSFQHYIGSGTRPIMDSVAALILHNLFGRFPGLEVLSIENGSAWVPFLAAQMDKSAKLGGNGTELGGALTDTPSELLRRHFYINPFHEEDINLLITHMGADRILFGSDWPHPEGLALPLDTAEALAGKVTEDEFWKIMRTNAAGLLGLA